MTLRTRIKVSTNWGLFFGVISWLLATGFTNKIPSWGVWSIVLSRALAGTLMAVIQVPLNWWQKGSVFGGVIAVPLAFISQGWPEFHKPGAFWFIIITGILSGLFTELAVMKYKPEDEKSS